MANFLKVDLDTFEMYAERNGYSYHIKMLDGDMYYYTHKDLKTGEVIDSDVCDIEHLRNGANFPSLVHWMARGYKGLPVEYKQLCVR